MSPKKFFTHYIVINQARELKSPGLIGLLIFRSVDCDVDVLAGKAYISACGRFAALCVSNEPLVAGPEELVLIIAFLESGLLGIGVLGKNYANAEV